MALSVVTPSSTRAVTLDAAKRQCRIMCDDYSHDTLVKELIERATASVESYTQCKATPQTLRLTLDSFDSTEIDIPIYPVTAITSVSYDDEDNVAQVLTEGVGYWADLACMYPKLCPVDSWPQTMSGKPASVRIEFEVGFSEIPKDIELAILLRISEMFDNPSESVTGPEVYATVNTVSDLLSSHKRVSL